MLGRHPGVTLCFVVCYRARMMTSLEEVLGEIKTLKQENKQALAQSQEVIELLKEGLIIWKINSRRKLTKDRCTRNFIIDARLYRGYIFAK